jgi:hypothetical protein
MITLTYVAISFTLWWSIYFVFITPSCFQPFGEKVELYSQKKLISLFVGTCFLKRFEFVCILLRWRPSHCSFIDVVKFLKQLMPSRFWQYMKTKVVSIVCVVGSQFNIGTLQATPSSGDTMGATLATSPSSYKSRSMTS